MCSPAARAIGSPHGSMASGRAGEGGGGRAPEPARAPSVPSTVRRSSRQPVSKVAGSGGRRVAGHAQLGDGGRAAPPTRRMRRSTVVRASTAAMVTVSVRRRSRAGTRRGRRPGRSACSRHGAGRVDGLAVRPPAVIDRGASAPSGGRRRRSARSRWSTVSGGAGVDGDRRARRRRRRRSARSSPGRRRRPPARRRERAGQHRGRDRDRAAAGSTSASGDAGVAAARAVRWAVPATVKRAAASGR